MTKALPLSGESKTPQRVPFDRVVLVLQGGGALGAYQGGVYQALHEAKIQVSWICGTSIGGINGALIAGNQPERRVERLREFWDELLRHRASASDACTLGRLRPDQFEVGAFFGCGDQRAHWRAGLLRQPATSGHVGAYHGKRVFATKLPAHRN